jgi:hypothetical protein
VDDLLDGNRNWDLRNAKLGFLTAGLGLGTGIIRISTDTKKLSLFPDC